MSNDSPSSPTRGISLDKPLAATEVLLTIAKDVSNVAPVPFMRQAAEASLGFLNIVQTVRENKEAWIHLARDVAQLVAAVATKLGSHTSDSDTSEQIEQLHSMISKVDAVVEAMKSRNIFKRVIGFRDDAAKLQAYREDLKVAIAVFGVRATITNAENMGRVSSSQNTLLAGQQSIHEKQEEVLLCQQMTNEYLQRIDTSINTLKAGSPLSVSPPYSIAPVSPSHATACPPHSESPIHYASPFSSYLHIMPSKPNVTIIHGNHITNNVQTTRTNIRSHQEMTINTANSHNTTVTSSRGRRLNKGRRSTVP
ncbi:hypothetical protein EYR38_001629 [Pleurotus pulmonarius]|nr:hypothetical protein EYR38_001629 [Pleurotus pulmonarius]